MSKKRKPTAGLEDVTLPIDKKSKPTASSTYSPCLMNDPVNINPINAYFEIKSDCSENATPIAEEAYMPQWRYLA